MKTVDSAKHKNSSLKHITTALAKDRGEYQKLKFGKNMIKIKVK